MKRVLSLLLLLALLLTSCTPKAEEKFDAAVYLKGQLGELYLGKFDPAFLEMVHISEREARENYEANLKAETEIFLRQFSIEYPTDPLKERLTGLYKTLYAKADYTVGAAIKQEDGSYAVTVTVRPLDAIQRLHKAFPDYLTAFRIKYAGVDTVAMTTEQYNDWLKNTYDLDYQTGLTDLFEKAIPETGKLPEQTVTAKVEKDKDGRWTVTDESFKELDQYILDYNPPRPEPQIYLYGEQHGAESILKKEFELWSGYYQNRGMRHLFVELPFYSAEFLNLWMKADGDEILNQLFADWAGTAGATTYNKEFYQNIKRECPETVFHGTDVGHQYLVTGRRFLEYLKENNLENAEQYRLTEENIEQGEYFYGRNDQVYRENKMVENFIREFDALKAESVMGIYGAYHTEPDAMDTMANQLKERYGDALHAEDLAKIPERVDPLTVNGKDYEAPYFGREEIGDFSKDYQYRDFWRLENAYDDFKDLPKTGNVLPYGNYPMVVEEKQVFVIDYIRPDGTVKREYHRSDGRIWQDMPSTEEFTIP